MTESAPQPGRFLTCTRVCVRARAHRPTDCKPVSAVNYLDVSCVGTL